MMETETILFIIAIVLYFGILAFGSKTAAGLDRGRQRRHMRGFLILALLPLCIVLIVTLPMVIDYSVVKETGPIDKAEISTLESVSKTVSSQSYEINLLQHEVLRLREDLYKANNYYRRLVWGLLFVILAIGMQIFISEFGEPEKGEIKAEPLDIDGGPTERKV